MSDALLPSDEPADAFHDQVKALLAEALEADPADRAALLGQAEPAVRAEVESLLALPVSEGFLTGRADDALPVERAVAPSDPLLGTVVGAYRLEGVLGEGGMGRVYAARRADGAFDALVAVKVIRPGIATDAVLRRFEVERRVLARLAHPGIARLLDAGRTDDGVPFVVMEHVAGEPITAYAARHRLSVEARLRLLVQTADAVAHAHRRMIVHRDLKPSNVLVAEDDAGQPVVKLLDFGIAHLLDPEAFADDPAGPLTESGLRPMSRPYAAPEQLAGHAITTATDVWALGVLLYELLTERRPFRADDRVGLETAIREALPTRPSTAVAREETTTGTAARARRLRGDLDAIALTALRKEPEQRYASAEALAGDLRRHLAGLPVEARAPSAGYRIRKFVARHRAAVGVAVFALVLLVGGALAYTAELRRERDRAEMARVEAEAAADFLSMVLMSASPFDTARRDTLRLGDVLPVAADSLGTLADRPRLQGRVALALGHIALALGRDAEAEPLLRLAVERLPYATGDGESARDVHLEALFSLGEWLTPRDSAAVAEAATLAEQQLAIHERERLRPARTAAARHNLAWIRYRQHRPVEADSLFRAALDGHRRDPSDSLGMAATLRLLGIVNEHTNPAEAEALLRESNAVRRAVLGEAHPSTARGVHSLATFLNGQRRFEEALDVALEAQALTEAALGRDHPDARSRRALVARIRQQLGDTEAAVAVLAEVAAEARAAADPDLGFYLAGYARALTAAARPAEADAVLVEAITLAQAKGEGGADIPTLLGRRAAAHLALGRTEQAIAFEREALAGFLRHFGSHENAFSAAQTVSLARTLARSGRRSEAEAALRESVRLYEAVYGPEHEQSVRARERTVASLLPDA